MIRRAIGIDLETAIDLLPQMHQMREVAEMSDGRITARRIESFGEIELAAHPIKATEDLGMQAVASALATQGMRFFGTREIRCLASAHGSGPPFARGTFCPG